MVNSISGFGLALGLGLGLFAAVAASGPGTASAETLNEALIDAYKTNPRLDGARARLRATDEQSAQAISLWRPVIVGTGSVGQIERTTRTAGIRSEADATRRALTLRITQNVFRGGRNFFEWRRAHANIRAERNRLVATEQEVFLDVVRAYTNVFRDEAVLRLQVGNERVLRRQLQATRDRANVGEVTRTDVAQAEAAVARAQAERIRAEADLEATRASYVNIVGRSPGSLKTPAIDFVLPKSRDELVEAARQFNPFVLASHFDELSARETVRIVQAELLPSISITGDVSRQWDGIRRAPDLRSDSASVTGQITIPLYQSGAVSSRLREAKQRVFERRADSNQTSRTVVETAVRAWTTLQATRSQVRALREQVRANRIALEGVQEEARTGARTVLDVLDAQQLLLDAQVALIRAERDQIVASYEAKAAMGQMTAVQLKLDVPIYDPESYYYRVRYKLWGTGPSIGPAPVAPGAARGR